MIHFFSLEYFIFCLYLTLSLSVELPLSAEETEGTQNDTFLLIKQLNNNSSENPVICQLINSKETSSSPILINPNALLFQSIQENNYQLFEESVHCGADLNARNIEGFSPIILASMLRQKNVINALLDLDASLINSTNESPNYSPLEPAVLAGRLDLVKSLLKSGVNSSLRNIDGDTALHLAAEVGEMEIVKELVKSPQVVDLKNNNKFTALHFAVDNNQSAIAKLLLEAGADVNAKGNDLSNPSLKDAVITPLHFAAIKGYANLAKMLIEAKADVNSSGPQSITPLLYAISGNQTQIADILLKSGANANSSIIMSVEPPLNMSALHIATKMGNLPITKELIKRGASLDARDWQNLAPLHTAILENQEEIAIALMDAEVDTNATIRYGDTPMEVTPTATPLHLAAIKGNLKVVQKLLEKAASVKARDEKNRTPLHLAAQNGHREAVVVLLKAGSDINATANYPDDGPGIPPKVTPLHLAASKGHLEVVKELLDRGTNMEAKDVRYLTALHVAARDHHKDIVKYLLDKGANVNGKMNYLNDLPGAPPRATALDFAECLDEDIVEELKKHGAKETDFYFTQEKTLAVLGIGSAFFLILVIGLIKYRFNCFR